MVSVLMSVYNEPLDWLKQSIDSILTQTFTDFEFIIINDKPDRLELAEFLKQEASNDYRIKIHTNPGNIGLTKSLNIGLKLCKGKYIARMDADDISLPTRFEKQVDFLEKNGNIGIVGSWIESFGYRKNIVKFPSSDNAIRINQLYSTPFDHPATMMRAKLLHQLNYLYDENIRYAQDQELWYRMGKISKFANIQDILYKHRYNANQISCKHINEQQANVKNTRRKLVNDFYSKYRINLLNYSEIKLDDIKRLRKLQKQIELNDFENLYLNFIVKSLYFSLPKHRFQVFLKSLLKGEFYSNDWTMKDILKLSLKYIRPNLFITTGLI